MPDPVVEIRMARMKIRRAKVVLFGFVVFLVGLVALADSGHGRQLFAVIQHVPAADKIGHFILFGVLSFLVNLLLRAAPMRVGRWNILKGSAALVGIVALEECSQAFFPSRTFDPMDLAAGVAGIFLFGQLAARYLRWKRSTASAAIARCGSR